MHVDEPLRLCCLNLVVDHFAQVQMPFEHENQIFAVNEKRLNFLVHDQAPDYFDAETVDRDEQAASVELAGHLASELVDRLIACRFLLPFSLDQVVLSVELHRTIDLLAVDAKCFRGL